MCLRVGLLKDAVGSPFGKADRLLYLHVQKLCRVGEHQHYVHDVSGFLTLNAQSILPHAGSKRIKC